MLPGRESRTLFPADHCPKTKTPAAHVASAGVSGLELGLCVYKSLVPENKTPLADGGQQQHIRRGSELLRNGRFVIIGSKLRN
jgi:hypothetical protein